MTETASTDSTSVDTPTDTSSVDTPESTPAAVGGRIMDLPDRVRQIAETDPTRLALIHEHRWIGSKPRTTTTTYGELSHRAEAVAVGLREFGVREGTLCSFMIPPCEDAMVAALALWRVGAVMVGIEPHSHGLRSVGKSIARVGPEVFLGTPEAQAGRLAFGWGKPTISKNILVGPAKFPGVTTLASLERPVTGEPALPDVQVDDPCVIAFTTGSTGHPKPTVMTHRNLTSMIDGVAAQWRLAEHGDVIDMPTFPIFWIIGLFHGGTVVVPPMNFATKGPGSADPAKLVATIQRHQVASFFGSPAVLTNLARHCADHGIKLPSINRIVAGGAEVYGPLYAAVKNMLVDGEIYSNYGATEALPIAEIAGATVLGETWARTEAGEGLCVGDPLAKVEVRIVDIVDDPIPTMDDAVVLEPGQIGEVVARSAHISDRYWDAPDEMTDNKIEDGATRWHRLGDTGWLDDQGRLWVCGRRSHRVITDERTYYPLCVEPVINTHAAVVKSALVEPVVGGMKTAAVCVELRPEARVNQERIERDLTDLAEQHDATRGLATFFFIDHLPVDKRHNAKIDRPGLGRTLSATPA
ncbi:MAG TPA: fatty acid CoA ligase family protein [Acidimicrobiales bacterium]|nr:fatty acid CoA ligase family protein [Acidimicrobiales bacterium]